MRMLIQQHNLNVRAVFFIVLFCCCCGFFYIHIQNCMYIDLCTSMAFFISQAAVVLAVAEYVYKALKMDGSRNKYQHDDNEEEEKEKKKTHQKWQEI